MPESGERIEIPNRALFKAGEVCDLIKVQPYVLRSWEMEFPELGVAKSEGGPRVYRRADVAQVVRIKHLLLVEGLTLAGARRRLEDEATPVGADTPAIDELIGQNARERLTTIKRSLRSLLDLLASPPGSSRSRPVARLGAGDRARPSAASRGKAPRPKRSAARSAPAGTVGGRRRT
jgi:DNA-binding transcriptional MerR regulator